MWTFFPFVFFLFTQTAFAEFTVPPLTDPVVDQAGMIDSSTEQQISGVLRSLRDQADTQISVLTINSLDGLPIEEASIKVTESWKLGGEKTDNGVLLLVAKEERSVRIEVGQGLEGALPDAYARRIIDNNIIPLFKSGDFNGGILVGVYEIIKRTNPDFPVDKYLDASPQFSSISPGLGFFALFFLIVILSGLFSAVFGNRRQYRRGGGWGSGSGWGGGGFGGGSGWGSSGSFGGGWSGGGGGFSGGGASGRW